MSGGFPDRLTQLRARWQGDPSSRIFLQLAEEYRHLGRVQDALAVLESGLKEHPGYLSALVAKGRCLLELGNAEQARVVLERVVQQDATQMVANKLLVRTYLETSEPEQARQRLELYSLLNDSDPEIEELRRRVAAMSRPPRAPDGPRSDESPERSRMDPTETPEAEVFDLGPADPVRSSAAPPEMAEDLFGLGEVPGSLPAAPPIPPPLREAPLAPSLRGEGNGAEPFPDPAPEASRRLYLAGLAAERIFFFGAAAETAAADTAAAATTAAADTPADTAAVPAPEAPGPATVTLGELYLRQGHQDEAERIFRLVVEREPDNASARAALARLAQLVQLAEVAEMAEVAAEQAADQAAPVEHAGAAEHAAEAEHAVAAERVEAAMAGHADRRPLDAGQLLAGLEDAQASPRLRKAYLLRSYLTRLQQARRSHVP
jgi:tetratricopeptide (TPR) repeat protein